MTEKRQIRLKEFSPNITKVHTPSNEYLTKSPRLEKRNSFFQRTNSFGFIETHLNYQSKTKVVLIGDSFIENIFVDESKRISSRIEQEFLKNNKKIKVYNAGVSGSTGLGLLNLMLNKIIPIKPDLVIYTQPSCDFAALLYEDGYYNNSKFFGNILPLSGTHKPHYETIQENCYQLENNLSLLSTMCKLYNIPLCIATCCSISSKRQLKMMNDIIRKGAGYDIIDLDNIMPRNDYNFYDRQHLTELGSGHLSNIFYSYISQKLPIEKTVKLAVQSVLFRKNHMENKNIILSEEIIKKAGSSVSTRLKLQNHSVNTASLEIEVINSEQPQHEIKLFQLNLPALHTIEFSVYIPNNINNFYLKLSYDTSIDDLSVLESDLYVIQ